MNNPFRRADLRTEIVSVELRGIATRNDDNPLGPFMIKDISNRGLRIWAPEQLNRGEIIKITVGKPFLVVLTCDVRWCKAASELSEGGTGYAIGLRVIDSPQRLEALHRAVLHLEAGGVIRDP